MYYRTCGPADSVLQLLVFNIRIPYTVQIPLPHAAHDKRFNFFKKGTGTMHFTKYYCMLNS